MVLPLIRTKFFIPRLRSTHVKRERLLDSLNQSFVQDHGFNRKLTLVCAPAGYGKTTLTIEWLSDLSVQTAWLTLDENDNDPVRFLTYLIHAIRQVYPEVGDTALGMLQTPQLPPPEGLLAPVLNEIAALSSLLVLVIDDYHLLQMPAIHPYLNFMIEYQPPQMHMVIVSREDPPFPLHRLRARGQIFEVRQDNIRFTREEAANFIENMIGQPLSIENLTMVQHRTEGWVTGMQLLALSLQEQANANDFIQTFASSDRFVLDYLFEEVFHQQPPGVQEFLMKTSILDQFSAALCQVVSGNGDSARILDALDKANLFLIPVDYTQTRYRYHRLFLDLLKHRLKLRPEISLQELHGKASRWYEEAGELENAIHHALAGKEWRRAVALIYQVDDSLLKGGEIATLLTWMKQIPQEIICSKSEYCLMIAWPLLLVSDVNAADDYLAIAEKLAADNPSLLGQVAAAQAFYAQILGDEASLIAHSERALTMLDKDDLSSRCIVAMNLSVAYWHQGEMEKTEQALGEALGASRSTHNTYSEITCLLFQGRVHAVRGQLQQAFDFFKRVTDQRVQVPIVALAYLDLAALHYEWNDLQACEHYLEKGADWIGSKGNYEFRIAALLQRAQLSLAQGEDDRAKAILEDGWEITRTIEIPVRTRARLAARMAEAALVAHDLEAAEHWAAQVRPDQDAHPFYRYLNLTSVRVLLAQKRLEEASALLQDAYRIAHNAGWKYGLIKICLLQTLAARDESMALDRITEALTLAEGEKFIRVFAEHGAALVPLLRKAAMLGISPVYVGDLLAALGKDEEASLPPDVEALSGRELEVVRLLALGMTNQQIADQLVVSVSTVKSHVHHICGKLGVKNRTQAVSRARQTEMI